MKEALSTEPVPLPLKVAVQYSLPATVFGYMVFLIAVYLMKYTTDVLMMAPAVIGSIMFIARIWDAFSDPLVGYLSDRTTLKMGRRRPWILFSSVPLGLGFYMMWCPPESLTGTALVAWMAFGVLFFYTAFTTFSIPSMSLGAELTDSYDGRTRLFGIRHGFNEIGTFLAVLSMFLLTQAADPGPVIQEICFVVAVVTVIVFSYMTWTVKEPVRPREKIEFNAFSSFKHVLSNGYALRLAVVMLLLMSGTTAAGVYTPYVAEYVLKTPDLTAMFLLIYSVVSIISIPVWVYLSRFVEKKVLWMYALLFLGVGLGSGFFLEEGSVVFMCCMLALTGFGGGSLGVMAPSVKSDVIDYGEYLYGKRTEGAYFAVYNFIQKAAAGLTFFVIGILLELGGFEPGVEQTESSKTWILTGFALLPMSLYLLSAYILSGYSLTRDEHARILSTLSEERVYE